MPPIASGVCSARRLPSEPAVRIEPVAETCRTAFADLFPGVLHVVTEELEHAADTEIWSRAAADGLVVATRDTDFLHRSLLLGPPPAVVWLRVGNASTNAVEHILRRDHAAILRLIRGEIPSGLLILDP